MERTGAITNATTSQDRTNYFETVGSQDLPLAIEIEADRMRNLRLREEDRRPEMTVVRNEYERGENNPSEVLKKKFGPRRFWPIRTTTARLAGAAISKKCRSKSCGSFTTRSIGRTMRRSRSVGDFDPATALKLVKQYYGPIPRSPHPIPEVYTEEPPQTGPRRVTVKRPGELGVVTIAQKMPPATNADYAPLRVLGAILSDGRNSRMYQALTDKNLTTSVDAAPSFNHDPSLFIIRAQLAPMRKHADVEQRMLDEIKRVQEDGVASEEVAAAIAKLTANTAYSRDGSLAEALALSECIAAGDWRLYDRIDEAVRRVTPADVERVAKRVFDRRSTRDRLVCSDRRKRSGGCDFDSRRAGLASGAEQFQRKR